MREGRDSRIDTFPATVTADYFLENSFRIDSVNSKAFVLMLANRNPLSFVSGAPINLEEVLRDYNRNEFHHLNPRSYYRELQNAGNQPHHDLHCLANFSFMSRIDNTTLGGVAPSIYRGKMPGSPVLDAILERSFCPYSLFDDNFDTFVQARAERLKDEANRLIA